MSKDKRVAELPQISPAAVVALERVGCLSCTDLVNADFERIAFVLDDYNEATRLVREARRLCGLGAATKDSSDPAPPGPLAATVALRMPKGMARSEPARSAPSSAKETPRASSPSRPKASRNTMSDDLINAIGALALGLDGEEGFDRESLKRRLLAMLSLLEYAGTETELIAVALLDPVEAGVVEEGELSERFGKETAELINECLALRAIPVLPTGKLPRSYLDRSQNAPAEARRVCAAHVAAMQSADAMPDGPYMELHLEALRAGGAEEFVDSIVLEPERGSTRKARRAA